MRPSGEVKLALLKAAADLVTPARAPTLRELTEKSKVGQEAALHTVRNMVRAGDLVIARLRAVPYRNKPVAEYAPAADPDDPGSVTSAVARVLGSWVR